MEYKRGQVLTVKNLYIRFYFPTEQNKWDLKEVKRRYSGEIEIREIKNRGTDLFDLIDLEVCTGNVLTVNGGMENIGWVFPEKLEKAMVV